MSQSDATVRGREAFARREWRVAYEQLVAADGSGELEPADVERLATAAYLVGKDAEAIAAWKRLHQALVEAGEPQHAARCGFWLGFCQLLRGQAAESRGWIARARRLLDAHGVGCAEQGYVLAVEALWALGSGDAATGSETFAQALAIAERFGDPDLLTLALLGRGQALTLLGETARGIAMLDEAMVAIVAGEVHPILAGILCCAAILTCQRILDVRRAREWTVTLIDYCESQPQSVPFRVDCSVHRSQILTLQGDWTSAHTEAERACKCVSDRFQPSIGRAFYQRGELHRLRGELALAEEMYREAVRNGCEPQPGISLLRLAQGQLEAAVAAIRRVVAEARDHDRPGRESSRVSVLGPYVEIMLATDLAAAREAAEELVTAAARDAPPFLRATAAQAMGAVLLEEGDANAALAALREAWTTWQELDAPYEAARVRVLIARACEQLGDRDTAQLHREAAAVVFQRLGAALDVARLEHTTARPVASSLSERELEVLVLVASGSTNKQIAAALAISEHTVARHLANIYNKIGVGSRTAAAAFAHEHQLLAGKRGRS